MTDLGFTCRRLQCHRASALLSYAPDSSKLGYAHNRRIPQGIEQILERPIGI